MSRRPLFLLGGMFAALLILLLSVPQMGAQTPVLVINEIMPGNGSTTLDMDFTNYSAWIEIYNDGTEPVDLKNYTLSYNEYKIDTPFVWTAPKSLIVPAKGRAIIWADEEDAKGNHANFKFDMRGNELTLLDPSSNVVDAVTYDMRDGKALLADVSYGRQTDGGDTWVYYDQPTPGASNSTTGFAAPTVAEMPELSPPGGFYSAGQSVTISTTEATGTIYYTTDGSIPTVDSTLYEDVAIDVSSPTVIRARLVTPDKLDSPPASDTYLIGVSRNLPVISLATKPDHLFDNTIGIYVVGTNGILGSCYPDPANWYQSWERPASMEMYETDGSRVVSQDVGFEIHGGCTRAKKRKSLEIKTRRTYGDNDIDYQILPDKPMDSYKRLILRNSGGDVYRTLFRDALQHYLVKDMMDVDYQAYRPVVVFLNGAYWGIHNLRDKADESFVEQNYDLDEDTDFDMLGRGRTVDAGNRIAWDALYDFITKNDLTVPANYDYVKSQVDIEEYMNYYTTQLYGVNTDWPQNNIRYWRAYDNGRWRWVLYDTDKGFDLDNINRNYLSYALSCRTCDDKAIYHYTVFRKLMKNVEFKEDFVQRFASHISITYNPVRVNGMIDWFEAGIAPEMPAHIARWGTPRTLTVWESYVDELRSFNSRRTAVMTDDLDDYLGRPGMANLTININGGGDVNVAGVQAPGSGYTGAYFKTVPLTLEAVPQRGWQFVRWQETGETDSQLTVTLTDSATYTAVFEVKVIPKIVINELYYNPPDSQGDDEVYEFLELVNTDSTAVDLSGFSMSGITFTFPDGSSIDGGEIIVLAILKSSYEGNGYQVFQWEDGKLSNGGETVALLDEDGNAIDEVTYDDGDPWPTTPDGDGPSLALLDPALDNSLVASWAASPDNGGSPGVSNPTGPPVPAKLTIIKEVVGATPVSDWSFTGDLGAFTLPAAGGQQEFNDLDLRDYTITETAAAGYGASVSCTNGASGTNSVTVALGSGADVTCTFTNSEIVPAKLTIIKQVSGALPASDWAYTGDLGAFTLPAAGGQRVFNDLDLRDYTITETTAAGYSASVSCSSGESGTNSVTVTLGSGADVTCTFINSEIVPAKLTIIKQVSGALPASDWAYTGDLGAFTLPAAGGQRVFNDLDLGDYTITETAAAGYSASVSCSSGESGTNSVTVALGSGADVTCTFTNSEIVPAKLTIIKEVVGEIPGADWAFTGDLGAFTLPAAGGEELFSGLAPGGYTITETAVTDYETTVSCTNGASGANSVSVTLDEGAEVSCTFTNTENSSGIPPYGHCSPPVPGNVLQSPGFEDGKATWGLYTDKSAAFSIVSKPEADPYECDANARVSIRTQGSNVQFYQKKFTLQPDTEYTLRFAARSSGGEDVSLYVHRDSSPYTNYGLKMNALDLTPEWQVFQAAFKTSGFNSPTSDTRLRFWLAPFDKNGTVYEFDDIVLTEGPPPPPPDPARLTIIKEVVGAVPVTDWSFTGDLGAFTLPAAGGTRVFNDLGADTYQVTETVASGYRSSVSCTNGAAGVSSVNVTLAAGADVTCTFVNTETPPVPATLTIVKEVVGAVPATDWSFTGDLGAFTLPAAGGQQVFNDLDAGSYTVTETAVAEYDTSVSCTSGESGTNSVTLNLADGADVTCTFTNSEMVPAKLTIIKQVSGAVPATDWSFTGDLGAFTLPAAGGQQVFNDLDAGSYTVTETAVAEYDTSVSCTSGESGTNSVMLNLADGADVTCTFTNTEDVGGSCPPPVPGNVLLNPGFEEGTANWRLYTDKSAVYSVVSKPAADPYECDANARVTINTPGTNVQFYQRYFLLKEGTTYILRLAARSSGGEDISVYIHQNRSPYTNYGLKSRTGFDLTTEWQSFEVEFTAKGFTGETTDTRLRVWLAPFDKTGTVYEFDDFVLIEK